MGGFGHDLKRKILGNNAHIVVDVDRPGGFGDWQDKLGDVRDGAREAGGGAATPVVGGEAMASSASNTAGALVRGIDPDTIGDVIDLKKNIDGRQIRLLRPPREARSSSAPDEVVGTRPRRRALLPRARLHATRRDADPSLREFLKQNEKVYPGVIIGRELAQSRSTCSSATR